MRASPRRIERLVKTVFVIDRIQDWPFELPGSSVVTARSYLADAAGGASGDAQVINLCRADRYQGRGYYVSLLAEARGHRPLPDVKTVEDLKSDEQIQRVGRRSTSSPTRRCTTTRATASSSTPTSAATRPSFTRRSPSSCSRT